MEADACRSSRPATPQDATRSSASARSATSWRGWARERAQRYGLLLL